MQAQITNRLGDVMNKARRLQALLAEHDLDDSTITLCKLGLVADRTARQFEKLTEELERGLRNRDPKPDNEE